MKRIALISDIHISSQDTESLYIQLKDVFFKHMKDFKPDLIVDDGDTTDSKLFLHTDDTELFLEYGKLLKEHSKNVLIVQGTWSHCLFNYKIFKYLLSDSFRIIWKAENIDYCDLDLLILPEEYDLKPDYYNKFFNINKKYDFVFGHGMFTHIAHYARSLANVIQNKHSKVWDWKEFENLVYGYVVFGHIHEHSEYKNILYPGSFSRDSFGEEDPKGYYIFEYDEVKKKVVHKEFIENTLAPKYKDILVSELPKDDINKLFNILNTESKENFKIRIVIDEIIEEGFNNNIIAFSRSHNNTSLIKKISKHLIKDEEKEKEKIKQINEQLSKFKNKDFFEITKILASEQGLNITNEEINEIITKN